MSELMQQKLAPELLEELTKRAPEEQVSVIIQIPASEGERAKLGDTDREMVANLGGTILDDLWLIKGYSADLPVKAFEVLVLSPRVQHVHLNTDVSGA